MLRDIPAGGELLSVPKVPLQLRDIPLGGPQDPYSDRESGEYSRSGKSAAAVN